MPLRFREVVDHSPFQPATFRWRMGVRARTPDVWLQPDDRRLPDLVEKDRLTRERPGAVFVASPGSESASAEVCDLVAADLARRGWALGAPRDHPLQTAGLSVQEDLCLMEAVEGAWRLTAGSVCFPTRWDLPSKLGQTLWEIHDPVPDYADQLGERVERFFDRMTPDAVAVRLNWSIVDDDRRRLEPHVRQAPLRLPTEPATGLFLRIERQTLRRLVRHEAIVFGIRIHTWPLADVVSEIAPSDLAHDLETMSGPVAAYKNLDGLRSELSAWLRARDHADDQV